ncbi:alpha/beta hydrolase family esterase [Jatrophihabitans sp. YIM 134969]
MGRLRIIAIAVLAVVAVVAGGVALALGASGAGGDRPSAAPFPTPTTTPTDVTAGVVVPAGVAVSVGRLDQDGVPRTYLILAPTTVEPSTPLIIGLHGRNATPGEESLRDGLIPYVASGDAVLVYPVGYEQAWNNDDGCCGLAVAKGLDDVAFVGMVDDAVRDQFGLTGPNYLLGYSNGGRLAYAIACRDTARYAAIATIGATPTTPECPDADVPVPLFAGVFGDDTELPTHEDPQPVATVLADLEQTWTARNQCVGSPSVARAGETTVRTWTSCTAGTVLETAVWARGGHIWPEARYVGRPDGADLVWSFFAGVASRAALAAG